MDTKYGTPLCKRAGKAKDRTCMDILERLNNVSLIRGLLEETMDSATHSQMQPTIWIVYCLLGVSSWGKLCRRGLTE